MIVPALLLLGIAGDPVVSAWIVNRAPQASRPDVHSVAVTDEYVRVRSIGVSLRYLGPLQAAPAPEEQLREFDFNIPRHPVPETGVHARVPVGVVGTFVNGVPIYNQFETVSYNGEDLWHYDPLAGSTAAPGMLEELLGELASEHAQNSPLIGFALDGYPVYGPWSGGRRMTSSYRLHTAARERPEAPAGAFAEDYEYVRGSGDLDEFNGRFAITPEYPQGTYAYFLSTGNNGKLAFPYLLAARFYGKFGAATPAARPGMTFHMQGDRLMFRVSDAQGQPIRHLQRVHEKPIHLIVVSKDLTEFEHIHPELTPNDEFEVTHKFAQGGHYTLYAEYTVPGSPQRVERFEVDMPGEGLGVKLVSTAPLVTGRDIELRFELSKTDLDPYLGAWAHFVVIDERQTSFIHAHPLGEGISHSHTAAPGPSPKMIATTVNFEKAGTYKLWAQFQRHGQVAVFPFILQVAEGAAAPAVTVPADAVRIDISSAGFFPARVQGRAGAKLKLAFVRDSKPNCGNKVVFPATGFSGDVTPGAVLVVEVQVPASGELAFTCGMGMNRGAVVAR